MSLPTFTYVLSSLTRTRILSNFFSGIASACTTIWQVVGAQYPLDAYIPLNTDLCPLQHSGKRNHRSDSRLVTHTLAPCLIRWIRLSTILTSSPRVRNGKHSQAWTKTVFVNEWDSPKASIPTNVKPASVIFYRGTTLYIHKACLLHLHTETSPSLHPTEEKTG